VVPSEIARSNRFSPGMNRQTLSGAGWLAAQSTEWLVLAGLLSTSIPPIVLHHHSLTVVPTLNLIDGSWLLATLSMALERTLTLAGNLYWEHLRNRLHPSAARVHCVHMADSTSVAP
jgi:hypothetical protein